MKIQLFLILFVYSNIIISQIFPGMETSASSLKCKERGERFRPKSFSDCDVETVNTTICCFFTGTYNGERSEGCVAMDRDIFSNKSVNIEYGKVSAILICDSNYNYEKYFKNTYFLFLFIFIIFI